jgi:hypothetical protein
MLNFGQNFTVMIIMTGVWVFLPVTCFKKRAQYVLS